MSLGAGLCGERVESSIDREQRFVRVSRADVLLTGGCCLDVGVFVVGFGTVIPVVFSIGRGREPIRIVERYAIKKNVR